MHMLFSIIVVVFLFTPLVAQEPALKQLKQEGTIYISNQSFAVQDIHLLARCNDKVIADQNFAVKTQHNWIAFKVPFHKGMNAISIQTKDGTVMFRTRFQVGDKAPNIILNYWKSDRDQTPKGFFSFYISTDPIRFA